MSECIISEKVREQITVKAGLVGLGLKVRELGILQTLEREVKIAQKTVKYTPTEKLTDALIAILSGAKGLVEVNKRVRSDAALQAAFGRDGCAEQSVVQDTLDACTANSVKQMQAAVDSILRAHSQVACHAYGKTWLILEVDMTGRPCGRKAEFASKGYFAKQRNRRGRQEGYVVASQYDEIVVKRLYEGTTQLNKAFQPLMQAAQQALNLTAEQRARTILRVDSGAGSVDDVNWALEQGYQLHGKDYSSRRAEHLAESVTVWFIDPCDANRQMGWVTETTELYIRPVRRIAVRCRKNNGQWGTGVILSTLSARDVLTLTGQSPDQENDLQAVLLAYVHFYDLRGGGIEIEIKEDKQGLGMPRVSRIDPATGTKNRLIQPSPARMGTANIHLWRMATARSSGMSTPRKPETIKGPCAIARLLKEGSAHPMRNRPAHIANNRARIASPIRGRKRIWSFIIPL